MADTDEPKNHLEFQKRINDWAMKILEAANENAQIDPLAASAAVVSAAGRIAAINGLDLGIQVQLFMHQYEVMQGVIRQFESEVATPTETPKSGEAN